MKNKELWKANKFILNKSINEWVPNKQYAGISVHSYIIAKNQIEYYQQFIKKYCYGNMLDCGCGDVPYYGIYKDQVADVYCIDWENTGTQQVHIDQFVDLNKPIAIDSNKFDSILLSDVLEHIAEPDSLLKELYRLLKPGGKLVIMVPFLYRIHEEPYDYHRYTEFSLKYMAEKHNFKVLELASYGGIVDCIFDLLNKGLFNTPFRSKLIYNIYRAVIKMKKFHNLNEERRYSFPLGYCIALEK